MAIKLKHTDTYSTYFITFTCVGWISLVEISKAYDKIYSWFTILKDQHNAHIIAYVIMPNHLHVIVHFRTTVSISMQLLVMEKDLWLMKLLTG